MWYLSQWHQRVTGCGHRNAVSSEGFEPLVTPYVHTHIHPCRAATFTGVKHTSVHVHVCMTPPVSSKHLCSLFSIDLVWPSCVVGFVAVSNTAKKKKKKKQPELLVGLGLICNHRKGKEKSLSCATAINNPQTCILNHKQEPSASLLRWWLKEGIGKRERFYSFVISQHLPHSDTIHTNGEVDFYPEPDAKRYCRPARRHTKKEDFCLCFIKKWGSKGAEISL